MSQFDPLEPMASAAASIQLVLPTMTVNESQKVETGIVTVPDAFQRRSAAVTMPVPKLAGSDRTEGGTFGGLDMIGGEELVHVQRDVTEVSTNRRQHRGVLFVSNFRLAFQADAAPKADTVIPLCLVSRMEKQAAERDSLHRIEILCKNFRRAVFCFVPHTRARSVTFDLISRYAFPETYTIPFFAFSCKMDLPEDGWKVYDAVEEYKRLGLPSYNWRLSTANTNYAVCDTYPSTLVVPNSISDDMLRAVAHFRSRARLPALCWKHPASMAVMLRCSQPRVGIRGTRCAEDEALFAAIFSSNPLGEHMHIVDARPRLNAVANTAKGAGFENTDNYPHSTIKFMDIENIHKVRDSLNRLVSFIETVPPSDRNWYSGLENTQWLSHIRSIMVATCEITQLMEKRGESVIVHCSDGWDRTSQLTALSQLLMDPYYRTIVGFEVLIEKEWLSFGHMFAHRVGHGVKTHSDERAPIFLQFMDCVWQVIRQFPSEFEFTERLLVDVLDHMYSCQFGTFLFDCERQRAEARIRERTPSLWSLINSNKQPYLNPHYVAPMPKATAALVPNLSSSALSLWGAYFCRWTGQWSEAGDPARALIAADAGMQVRCAELQSEVRSLRLENQSLKRENADLRALVQQLQQQLRGAKS